MTPENLISEHEPTMRDQTVELIHLLERLPLQKGKTVIEVLHPDEEESILEDEEGRSLNIVGQFIKQREVQKEERDASEFKPIFMRKYHSIMDASQITDGCKEFLFWSIDQAYDIGVNKNIRLEAFPEFELYSGIPEPFGYLLCDYEDNPSSSGIFERDSAKNIEMKIYNRAILTYDLIQAYYDMVKGVFIKDEPFEIASDLERSRLDEPFLMALFLSREVYNLPIRWNSAEKIFNNYEQLFTVWRMQIEQNYGIIPHTEFSTDPKYFA